MLTMSTLIIDTVDIVDTVEAGTTLGSVTINLKNANQLISIMGLRDASASKNNNICFENEQVSRL